MLGVRASDAQAFCRWLSTQAKGAARYRLPDLDEWEAWASDEARLVTPLPPGGGCWITSRKDVVWRSLTPPPCELLRMHLRACVKQDWAQQPASLTAFARSLQLARQLTRLLACNPEDTLSLDFPSAVARLQGCDLERLLEQTRQWTVVLERMEILVLAHASDFHRTLVSDLDGQTSLNERARVFTRMRDLAGLLVGAGDLSRELVPLLQQAIERGGNAPTDDEQAQEAALRHEEHQAMLLIALRVGLLHLACFLRAWSTHFFSAEVIVWLQHFLRWKDYENLEPAAFEHMIAGCLDLYLTLVILELRREEQLPAWEGILLVTTSEEAAHAIS